ncbi:MAG: energy transducer TonB [Bacteroidetes bacterium]|nr:energy transducer TonB [Bacteroidota bacterium]
MRLLFVILFLPLFSFSQINPELTGLWVKAKVQKDGQDAVVEHEMSNFLKFNFTDDGFVDRSTNALFNEYKLLYKQHDDVLQIGGVFFHVINMKLDTMIVSLGEGSQKTNYIFLKVHDLKIPSEKLFDSALKDSVYKANLLLFPQCNGKFYDFLNAISAKPDTGELKINFIINKKGKVKNCEVVEANGVSKDLAKSVDNALESLEWAPAQMNDQSVNCLVTIDLHFKKLMRGGQPVGYLQIDYPFLAAAIK